MRLDEWQKYLESQYVADAGAESMGVDRTAERTVVSSVEPSIRAASNLTAAPLSFEERSGIAARAIGLEIETIPAFDGYLKPARQNSSTVNPREEPPAADAAVAEPFSVLVPMMSGFAQSAEAAPADSNVTASRPGAGFARRSVERRNTRSGSGLTSRATSHQSTAPAATAPGAGDRVPRHIMALLALDRSGPASEVAQRSYKRRFDETRHDLIARLLDPILSLEEAARLLNVCPTTVRRYTNRGILTYYRKEPDRAAVADDPARETRQRRFRLSDILAFLDAQHGESVDEYLTAHSMPPTPGQNACESDQGGTRDADQ